MIDRPLWAVCYYAQKMIMKFVQNTGCFLLSYVI